MQRYKILVKLPYKLLLIKVINNNYLSFQSTKTGTTWDRALYFESETLNATFGGTVIASQGFIGNASTATTLQTARNIALGGDVTGTATSFPCSSHLYTS